MTGTAARTGGADAGRVVLLLANRLVPVDAKPLTASELWPLVGAVADLGSLLDRDVDQLDEIPAVAAVGATRVRTLLDAATAVAFAVDRLDQTGIWTVTALDDDYPPQLRDRLGNAVPPLLHGAGEVALLRRGGLAVVGSRDVDADGGEVARDAARLAGRTGRVVVSGGARGVDQLAMAAADEVGGEVVGVLAESLAARLRTPDVRRAIGDGRVCLCTPYRPDAGFRAANAMGRNKLIYALADLTLVVASDLEKGGSWSGATEALRRGFGRVAVWRGPGEGPGNAALEAKGAIAVRSIDELDALLDAPADPTPVPPPTGHDAAAPEQLGLAL